MHILRKEDLEIAVINPKKALGEKGQYQRYRGNHRGLEAVLNKAREKKFEIRRYVEHIPSNGSGEVPLKYVLSEIPPQHVQPFHSHSNVEEINLISSGNVYFIESDVLSEVDINDIKKLGTLLRAGDVVISTVGKRHTVANLSNAYAFVIGTISSAGSVKKFKPDWKR